jgi:hypothetical protein
MPKEEDAPGNELGRRFFNKVTRQFRGSQVESEVQSNVENPLKERLIQASDQHEDEVLEESADQLN